MPIGFGLDGATKRKKTSKFITIEGQRFKITPVKKKKIIRDPYDIRI